MSQTRKGQNSTELGPFVHHDKDEKALSYYKSDSVFTRKDLIFLFFFVFHTGDRS